MVNRDYMRDDFGGGAGGMQLQMPRLTPVVKQLLIINGVVFLVHFITSFFGAGMGRLSDQITYYLGLNPGTPWLFPLQIFTYQFLHSVQQTFHLLGNAIGLYFFGTAVEGMIGSRRFLRLYLLSGLFGGLGFLLWSLILPGGPCIGASGAVAGVLVYFCLVNPNALVFLFFIPIRAWVLGVGWLGLETLNLLVQLREGGGATAHSAHLGGALMGFLFLRGEGLVRGWLKGIAEKQAAARRQEAARDRERMDQLLAKVNEKGLQSLTDKERRFLQEMSKRMR